VPEREAEGASGAAGWRGPGSTPEPLPTALDWILGIGIPYVLAILVVTFLFVAAIGVPVLILESHLGLVLLPRVEWAGCAWFLLPYGIVAALARWAPRRYLPVLCGLLVGIWLIEGVFLCLHEIALGV
jgi:hypothetical protein